MSGMHNTGKGLDHALFHAVATALIVASIFSSCATRASSAPPEGKEDSMKSKSKVLVMAHRGFRAIAPENTLLSAQKGFESGADYWELDVAASTDEVLVVLHDETLTRTTDATARFPDRKPWNVYHFSFDELRSLDAGSWYAKADPFGEIASGRVKAGELASFQGLKLPTLQEALELTKAHNWKVNVEIKDATGEACDPWIVERTAAMIRKMDMASSVIVSSFNHEYLARMKKAAPEIALGALTDKPVPDPVGLLKRIGAVAYHPNYRYLDKKTVQDVRTAGFDVNVWTPNTVKDYSELVDWGVTGIITDYPDKALSFLGRK
jgi:glycerophosphoryl diester phosphodiesterase